MKSKIALAIALLISASPVRAEKIALINGTMINPGNERVWSSATIVIDGDKIAAAGDVKTISAPKDARQSIAKANSSCPDISTRTFTSFNRAICSRGRTVRI